MFAEIFHKLAGADDIAFRHDVPIVRIAVNARNLAGGELKNFENLIRAIQRAGRQRTTDAAYKNDNGNTNQRSGVPDGRRQLKE